jgi:hypothetical protein
MPNNCGGMLYDSSAQGRMPEVPKYQNRTPHHHGRSNQQKGSVHLMAVIAGKQIAIKCIADDSVLWQSAII